MTSDERFGNDRQVLSTDNNEYATGTNDENEWEEDIFEEDVPSDDEISDYFENPYNDHRRPRYNETGYDENKVEQE